MKKGLSFVLCLMLLVFTAGCQNAKTRAAEGAVIGGVLGAAAGGTIGHQSHHGGEGAAIGAAAGVLTGAIIGSQIKKPGQGTSGAAGQGAQIANPNQMSVQQIVDLSKQGANEDVIIDRIRLSGSHFSLTASDIESLRQQGVSQKIIDAMQGS
jgi:hypothetical protein